MTDSVPDRDRRLTSYAVGLLALITVGLVTMSGPGDAEDFALWTLAAGLGAAAVAMLRGRATASRRLFWPFAFAGCLAALYSIAVWCLALLFESRSARSDGMLTMLALAVVALLYLIAGWRLLRRDAE